MAKDKSKRKKFQKAALSAGLLLLSEHLIKERPERLAMIQEAVEYDWGEIILEVPFPEQGKKECITEKGLIMVIALDAPLLITTYFAHVNKVSALYHAAGHSRVPDWVYNRVMKNSEFLKKQSKIAEWEK